MAADVVLTTKSLAAQRSGMDLNNCTGQYLSGRGHSRTSLSSVCCTCRGNSEIFRLPLQLLSVLPPRGEEGIELEFLESALQSDGSRRENSERARLLLQVCSRRSKIRRNSPIN